MLFSVLFQNTVLFTAVCFTVQHTVLFIVLFALLLPVLFAVLFTLSCLLFECAVTVVCCSFGQDWGWLFEVTLTVPAYLLSRERSVDTIGVARSSVGSQQ